MVLRPMRVEDVDFALAIEIAAAEFPWSRCHFISSLEVKDHASIIEVNNSVVGFAIFKPVLCETTLLNIAVHPHYQRKGYARQLLEQGLIAQVNQGVVRCFLEVRQSNSDARSLYHSLGFVQIAQRKNYYPAKSSPEHAIVMICEFPQV